MKTINFSHKYNKLDDDVFTTIRGRTKINQLKVDEVYDICIRKERIFTAKIVKLSLRKIKDMPIKLLKKDIAPMQMKTHQDFIDLLNTFRRFNKIESENELLTIITMKKVKQEFNANECGI